MIAFFGWGRKVKLLGHAYIRTCGNCNNKQLWQITWSYRYFSVFFIRVASWDYEFMWTCPVCNHGVVLDDRPHAQRLLASGLEEGNPELSAADLQDDGLETE